MSPQSQKVEEKFKNYSRYLPELVIENAASEGGLSNHAFSERIHCAVMFADISGFTPLAERFSKEGAVGAEKLTATLNDYFTILVELVLEHGGDVLKFAGDAVLAIWQDGDNPEALAFASWRAAQCGLEIQHRLKDYEANGVTLRLRVAIGAGTANIAHVGGVLNRWEILVAGKPLEQVGVVSDEIEPGLVGISAESLALLEQYTQAKPVSRELAPGILQLDALAPIDARRNRVKLVLPEAQHTLLKRYLPAAITYRLDAGLDDFLGELRRLTILFVNLPDIHYSTPTEKAQEIMVALQESCYQYEGSINKLSVDDKGVSLLAALGLPPLAHEDDPDRGIKAAIAIQTVLSKKGVRCSIGVSSGRVYCGVVGSPNRREYTIMGDSVNLAARLMQNAKGGILCDNTTFNRASPEVQFSEPLHIKLKGKSKPEQVYQALSLQEDKAYRENQPIVGRTLELASLNQHAASLTEKQSSRVVLLEADQGYGKTRLKEAFIGSLANQSLTLFSANADFIECSTPYFAIKQLLHCLPNLSRDLSPSEASTLLRKLLQGSPALELLPLLNSVIPLDIEESSYTTQMQGELRATQTARLVTDIIEKSSSENSYVFVIDDVHWLDAASWGVLYHLSRHLNPSLVLLVARPMTNQPQELVDFMAMDHAEKMPLALMSAAEILELVCMRLGVKSLPDTIAKLIQRRAEGHPYFSEEMGYALREQNIISIENGVCTLAVEQQEGENAFTDLPDTIEGLILSRIDNLSPAQSTAIKMASVIGKTFSINLLKAIFPVQIDISEMTAQLNDCEQLNLIAKETDGANPVYIFKQNIIQEVSYSLLLNNQRIQLHAAVANWIELNTGDRSNQFSVIAFHWQQAGDYAKALKYYMLAIDELLGEYANRDAAILARKALALTEEHPISKLDHGILLSRLGQAQRTLGRMDDAQHYLEAAAKTFGFPYPEGKFSVITRILREAAQQFRLAKNNISFPQVSPTQSQLLAEAAHAFTEVQIVYYWSGNRPKVLVSCLSALNLSVASKTLQRTQVITAANFSLVAGIAGLQKIARYYVRLAERLAKELDHLPTTAWTKVPIGTYKNGLGQWQAADSDFNIGLDICKRLGDERQWATLSSARTSMLIMQGRLREARDCYQQIYEATKNSEDPQSIAWGLLGQARAFIRLGELEQIPALLEEVYPILDSVPFTQRIDYLSIAAISYLLEEKINEATEAIDECISMLRRPNQVTMFCGSLQLTIAYLMLKQKTPQNNNSSRRQAIQQFSKQLIKYYPITQPAYHYLIGTQAALVGNTKVANKALSAALDFSIKLDMPYEQCLIFQTAIARDVNIAGWPTEKMLSKLQQNMNALGIKKLIGPFSIQSE